MAKTTVKKKKSKKNDPSAVYDLANKYGVLSFDVEASSKDARTADPLFYSISGGMGSGIKSAIVYPTKETHEILRRLMLDSKMRVVMHNKSYDAKFIHRFMVPIRDVKAKMVDTMNLSWLNDNLGNSKAQRPHSLDAAAGKYLNAGKFMGIKEIFVEGEVAKEIEELVAKGKLIHKRWKAFAKKINAHRRKRARTLYAQYRVEVDASNLTGAEKREKKKQFKTEIENNLVTDSTDKVQRAANRRLKTLKEQVEILEKKQQDLFKVYALKDSSLALRLYWKLKKKLAEKHLLGWAEVERVVGDVAADMEVTGFPFNNKRVRMIDRKYIKTEVKRLYSDIQETARKILVDAKVLTVEQARNYSFKANDGKALSTILFTTGSATCTRKGGLVETVRSKKEREKNPKAHAWYKVDRLTLTYTVKADNTKEAHPLAKMILEVRALEKLRDAFINRFSKVHGRMHCLFRPFGTDTGRWSCVDGGTQIETQYGTLPISSIDLQCVPNTLVLTHNGNYAKVNDVFVKGIEDMYRVTTDDGKEIICTKKHIFYTPEGWSTLGELEVGKRIYSVSSLANEHERSPGYPVGEELRRTVPDTKTHEKGHNEKIQGESSGAITVVGLVGEEVRERLAGCTETAPVRIHEKQPARGEAASRYRRYGQAETHGERWGHDTPYVGGARCIGVSDPTDTRSSPYYGSGVEQSERNVVLGLRRSEDLGDSVSGLESDGCVGLLLRRPYEVLSDDEHRVSSPGYAPVRGEGPYTEESTTLSGIKDAARNDVLEVEPSGDHVDRGPVGQGCGVPEGSSDRGRNYRLRLSRQTLDGGGRRVLTPETGDAGERCEEDPRTYFVGMDSDAVHGLGRGEEYTAGGRYYRSVSISKIEAVGPRVVWDMDVEGDQSYVAEGLVNHNSSNPNLQQIPSRHKIGKKLRSAFIADDDYVLIVADYSQVELRGIAHVCNEPAMIDAYRHFVIAEDGEKDFTQTDLHAKTLEQIKKLCPPELWERVYAKICNFGLPYGIGVEKFAEQFQLEIEVSKSLNQMYFQSYPMVRYTTELFKQMWDGGKRVWEIPLTGRTRRWPEKVMIEGTLQDVRMQPGGLLNTKVQGLCADILKAMLYQFYTKVVKHRKFRGMIDPLAQVHDEVVIQARRSVALEVAMLLKWCMEYPWIKLRVPILSDVHIVDNWAEGKDGTKILVNKLTKEKKEVEVYPEWNSQLRRRTKQINEVAEEFWPNPKPMFVEDMDLMIV